MSLVARRSSLVALILVTGCYVENIDTDDLDKKEQNLVFDRGSNFNIEQIYAWAQSEANQTRGGNLFLKANLSRATADITTEWSYKAETRDTVSLTSATASSGVLVTSDKIITAAHSGEKLDYVINYRTLKTKTNPSHPYKDNFDKMEEHAVKMKKYVDEGAGSGTFIKFNQGRMHFDKNGNKYYLSAHSIDWFNLVRWKQLGLEPLTVNEPGSTLTQNIPLFDRFLSIWPVEDTSSLSFEHWSSDKRDISAIRLMKSKRFSEEPTGIAPTIKDFRFFPGVFYSSVLAYKAPTTAGGPDSITPTIGAPKKDNDVFVLSHNYRNTEKNPPLNDQNLKVDKKIHKSENLIHLEAKNLGDIDLRERTSEIAFVKNKSGDTNYKTNIYHRFAHEIPTNADALSGSSGGGYFTYKDTVEKYWNFFELQGVLVACGGGEKCFHDGDVYTDNVVRVDGLDANGDKYNTSMAVFSDALVNKLYETIGNNGLPYLGVPDYDECVSKAKDNAARELCDEELNCSQADAERPEVCLFRSGLNDVRRGEVTVGVPQSGGPPLKAEVNYESEPDLDGYARDKKLRILECFGRAYPGLGRNRLANLNVGFTGGVSADGKAVGTLGVICSPRSYTEWSMNWDFLYTAILNKTDGNLRGAWELEEKIAGTSWDGLSRRLFSQFYNMSWARIAHDPSEPVSATNTLMYTTPATQFCPPGLIVKGISYDHARGAKGDYVASISKIHCIDMNREQAYSETNCSKSNGDPKDVYPCTIPLFADKTLSPIPSGHPHEGRTLSQPIGSRANSEILTEALLRCDKGYHLTGVMIPKTTTGPVKSISSLCRPY